MTDTAERSRLEAEVARLEARLPDYGTGLVLFLMLVTIVDTSDRTVLATVFEDIRREFDVSDSSLGVLSSAYALLAGLSVIPFGFLTDRMSRVRLIALGFIPWAIAMFWQGAAGSFGMMFAARMFLGSIEATNQPATSALIGDYYRIEKRSSMYGLQSMSGTLGYAVGLTLGGVVATAAGWRMAFVVWGFIGLGIALLIVKVLPEPERGLPDALYHAQTRLREVESAATDVEVPDAEPASDAVDYRTLSAKAALASIFRIKTIWLLFGGIAISLVLLSALGTWTVSFYRRYHGMSAAGAGGVTAIGGLTGVVGILVANRINNWLVRLGRPELRLVVASGAQLLSGVFLLFALAAGTAPLAVMFFIPTAMLLNVPVAAWFALSTDIVVPQLRGRASAVRGVVVLVGTAMGPLIFGQLSDALGLRAALMASVPFAVVGASVSVLALRTYPADFARARNEAYRQNLLEESTVVVD